MKNNTSCSKCLFSNKADSDNPCDHGIIEHIKDIKQIRVEDDYYVIEDYKCKMGFSKEVYNSNQNSFTIEEIKKHVIDHSYIRYYLVIDLTHTQEEKVAELCDIIKTLDIKPSFVSFILFPSSDNKNRVKILKENTGSTFEWKIHNFIESISIDDAIHMVLDTNFKKNDSNFILIYEANKIKELNEDINELNNDIMIEQKPNHYALKNGMSNLYGLFIHFDNYQFLRSTERDINKAIQSIPGPTILLYGNNETT